MTTAMKKGYKALLAEAEAEIETMPAEDAMALLGARGVVFVDLRDPRELEREGGIPGAFPCPRGMLEFWVDPESPYAKPVFSEAKFVFFCGAAGARRSPPRRRRTWGSSRRPLGGGFGAWKAAGGPVAPHKQNKICAPCICEASAHNRPPPSRGRFIAGVLHAAAAGSRQQGLFVLVATAVNCARHASHPVRGSGLQHLRRGGPQKTHNSRRRARRGRCSTATFASGESLAIMEYLAEKYPDRGVWPARKGRAGARARDFQRDARGLHAAAPALSDELPPRAEVSRV